MILAAADYGLKKEGVTPPDALRSAWNCERWGTDAVFGQGPLPEWLLLQMNVCQNYFEAHRADKLRTIPVDEWAERYPLYFDRISHAQWLRMELKKVENGRRDP